MMTKKTRVTQLELLALITWTRVTQFDHYLETQATKNNTQYHTTLACKTRGIYKYKTVPEVIISFGAYMDIKNTVYVVQKTL